MILSTYQPFFAPFPLFFMKARLSSVMVILDDVQFPQRTTWLTRNRFKNDQGVFWLSIPVWRKGLGLQTIKDVRICSEGNWARKHLASLRTSYANAPYLSEHLEFVNELFSGRFEHLIDLNMTIIEYLKKHLMIDTPIILQSHLGIKGKGSGLLIEICRKMDTSDYLVQASAKKYLNQELFSSAGISLNFFTPRPPIYPQLWGDFVFNLSALDLLLNCGPKSHEVLGLGTSLK
jgi:hypothetical protein